MGNENERSLQKRPEGSQIERFKKGGLISNAEDRVVGSLPEMTQKALQSLNRDALENPNMAEVPERTIYLFDSGTKRLIMISKREKFSGLRGPDKFGLFAEMIELDDEGKPKFTLSNSNIHLPNEAYNPVAVGTNKYKMPPSHIEIKIEGKDELISLREGGKILLDWLQSVEISESDTVHSFLERQSTTKEEFRRFISEEISKFFPESLQGFQGYNKFADLTNFIIVGGSSSHDTRLVSALVKASKNAGLFPIVISPEEFTKDAKKLLEGSEEDDVASFLRITREAEDRNIDPTIVNWNPEQERPKYVITPSIVTLYYPDIYEIRERKMRLSPQKITQENMPWIFYPNTMNRLQAAYPIFSRVDIIFPNDGNKYRKNEPRKICHGTYEVDHIADDGEQYEGLLRKLKADLLLTKSIRKDL